MLVDKYVGAIGPSCTSLACLLRASAFALLAMLSTMTAAKAQTIVELNAYVGQAFTYDLKQGEAMYAGSGTAPDGMSLSGSLVLSGTPTAMARGSTYYFNVTAGTIAYTYLVNVYDALSITTSSLPHAVAWQPYSWSIATITGGDGSQVNFSIQGGNQYFTINSSGIISAGNLDPGTYAVTVRAQDNGGGDTTRTLYLTVDDAPMTLAPIADVTTAGCQAVSITPSVTNAGPRVLIFSAQGLPAGVAMSSATGIISGSTQSVGTNPITVSVADLFGFSTSTNFNIIVTAPQPTFVTTSLPNAPVEQAYSQAVGAYSCVNSQINFSATGLPSGLAMSSAGVITGTPTAPGTYSVVVTATDSNNASSSHTYSIAVTTPSLFITTNSLPTPVIAQAYSQIVATSGGRSPVTFAATGLPAGLAINASTGVISGSPTAAGGYTITVTATDYYGTTATATFTGSIAKSGSTVSLVVSSATAYLGAPVNFTATVAGSLPTGSVVFMEGGQTLGTAALSGGVATLAIRTLASGSHTVTASYSGDMNNNASVSSSVVVAVTFRPNPADDPGVRRVIGAEVSAAARTARAQLSNVQSRLDQMHNESDECASSGGDYCIVFNGAARVDGARPASNSEQDAIANIRKLSEGEFGSNSRNAVQKLSANDALSQDNHVIGDAYMATAPAPKIGQPKSPSPFFATRINVWTAGMITVGEYTDQGQLSNNRAHTGGVTLGIDTSMMPGLKTGVAFGVGDDHSKLGLDGSALASRNLNALAYASYQPIASIFVDGVLGYGASQFNATRWSTYADGFLAGTRSGDTVYGSFTVTSENKWEKWRLAPYLRFDLVHTSFGAYTENGDPEWALSYQSTTADSKTLAFGMRVAYDLETGPYRITPSARAEYIRYINGSGSQLLSYANDNSQVYPMVLPGGTNTSLQGSLGLTVQTREGVQTGLEYLFSTSGSSGYSNGLRGSLKVAF